MKSDYLMKRGSFRLVIILLIITITAINCKKNSIEDDTEDTDTSVDTDIESDDTGRISAVHEASTDYIYDLASVINIVLNGSSISANSSNVEVNGTTAKITAAGTYQISGSLSNGQLIVDAKDAIVKIILNGVSVSNSSTSPCYINNSTKTIIILADKTSNTFIDASSYSATGEPNATIFSNCDLSFGGTGTLTVKGQYADGISSDDGLIIKSGILNVTAVDDALRGKDYLIIHDGTISASGTTGNGLKSDYSADNKFGYINIDKGTFTLSSSNKDGINASQNVTIDGGSITISSNSSQGINAATAFTLNGGNVAISKCNEGIESGNITINDGTLSIVSNDDALNATKGIANKEANDGSSLSIKGGIIYINALNGDGIDSNGNFTMTAGTVVVHGPQRSPEVSMDVNGTSAISGGIFIASGPNSGNMIETFSGTSSQNSVLIKFSSSKSANSIIHIEDANENELLTFAPTRAYSYIIFSSPTLTKGASYTVFGGGSSSGTNINGYYTGGTYTAGNKINSITLTSSGTVTSVTL